MMIGSAEKAGSGVSKIMYGWEFAQWRRPYLLVESQPDRLILELPKFSILPDEVLLSLRSLFGDRVDLLGKEELSILAICQIEGEVNNNRLQESIDKHRTDITKILQELCKEGFLISENKSRWTTYHLNVDYLNTVTMDTLTPDHGTLTPNLDTLGANLDTSGSNLDTSGVSNGLIKPSKNRKLSKEKLSNLIVDTCKSEYMTLEQIALAVERSQTYLQNEILPILVKNGKLQRQYPDNPNHPSQAYKASGYKGK